MNAGRIFEIRVVREGSGYTRAELDFKPGRVYNSLMDLDLDENGFNPRGNGAFRSTVIIPPPGGWGTEENNDKTYVLARQLGGTRVGVFNTFIGMKDKYVEQANFRQIGIMDEVEWPVGNQEPLDVTVSNAVVVSELGNDENRDFEIGEEIHQIHTDPLDPAITHTAKGIVISWEDTTGVLRFIQDPEAHKDADGKLYKIEGGNAIIGQESKKEVYPDLTFGSPRPKDVEELTFVNGYMVEQVIRYSGTMLYLSNMSPVERVPTQSERISMILTY